ncbi:MAG: bestrophin family protein [Bacteroidia bacterium]|nr:bestrophin family protein [Bacteroidia bacterium]
MINYNSKNWFEAIAHFKASYVIRRTMRMCLGMGAFAAFITACDWLLSSHPELAQFNLRMGIEPAVFSLLGIFLSLMLVFRTNTSYDRWWEGRKQWGALVNQSRGLAVLFYSALGDEDRFRRRFFAKLLAAYVQSLSDHLRGIANHGAILSYSDDEEEAVLRVSHVPNRIVRDLYTHTELLYRDGRIDGFQLNQFQAGAQALLDIQGACERIRSTPIPFAHNFFIKLFIFAYLLLLPLVLAPIVGWWSILLTMFVAYALVGLEFISVEIEEPFGTDCNDLPTADLARKISASVYEILAVEPDSQPAPAPANYVVIS